MCVFVIVDGWVIVASSFFSLGVGWGGQWGGGGRYLCVCVVFLGVFFWGGGGSSVCVWGGLRVGCFSLRCMIGLCISCLNILIIPHFFACACRCCSFV